MFILAVNIHQQITYSARVLMVMGMSLIKAGRFLWPEFPGAGRFPHLIPGLLLSEDLLNQGVNGCQKWLPPELYLPRSGRSHYIPVPNTAEIAPIRIDFPVPVSPVRIFRPFRKSSSRLWARANFWWKLISAYQLLFWMQINLHTAELKIQGLFCNRCKPTPEYLTELIYKMNILKLLPYIHCLRFSWTYW